MGCPTQVELNDNLVFSITTHDPDTGVLTDADAVPDYWIYEEQTGVSINANTPNADVMAKLDDAHTTGFYTGLIVCTAANGFEIGKSYTIYIEATVDSDKGGICYGFNVTDIRADINAVLLDTGTDGVVVGAASKTGYRLSATGVDDIADEEYDNDGTAISLRGAIKLLLAVLAGKSSGGGTATIVFRDINDAKDRISATVDANGNRTAVGTRDAS